MIVCPSCYHLGHIRLVEPAARSAGRTARARNTERGAGAERLTAADGLGQGSVIPSHDSSRTSRLRPVWRKLPSFRGKSRCARGLADVYQRFFGPASTVGSQKEWTAPPEHHHLPFRSRVAKPRSISRARTAALAC